MVLKAAIMAGVMTCTCVANAQFAVEPPDTSPNPGSYDEPPGGTGEPALLRVRVGPALRIARDGTTGGLATALDVGRASGVRVSGIWTAVGQDDGVSQYGAELWLNLGGRRQLQPVVAAGAALVRTHRAESDDPMSAESERHFGAATVRASLEYALALSGADARLAAEALASIPAIEATDSRPWLTLAANLALGF